MVMSRKQVLVQFEPEQVERLDELARRTGLNRSELVRHAVRALLDADEIRELERRHEEGYRRIPQEPELTEAFGRIASEHWPEW
jgi:metal-responsive CopG/Arc/MetJ family transcriptional regulator